MTSKLYKRSMFVILPILFLLSGARSQDDSTTGEFLPVGTTGEAISGGGNSGSGLLTKPAAPFADVISSSQIDVTFSVSGNRKRAVQPTHFTIEISSDGSTFAQLCDGPYQDTVCSANNLTPDTTYYFRDFVSDTSDNSDYSDVVSARTNAGASSAGATTGASNSTGGANNIDGGSALQVGSSQSGLSAGVIAGIVIAVVAVVAAIVAVIAKTAVKSAAPVATHWLDAVAQNPLYVDGEQAFENPIYEPPAEAIASV